MVWARLATTVAVLGWSALAWAQSSGAPHRMANTVSGQQVVLRPDAPSVAPSGAVHTLYQLHCMGCHQATGAGEPKGRVPDLRAIGAYLHLPGGREFLVRVPGITGVGLSDGQIAELINWLLATKSVAWLPAGHRPYSGEEVRRVRQVPLVEVASERERLVALGQRQGLPLVPLYTAATTDR